MICVYNVYLFIVNLIYSNKQYSALITELSTAGLV